MKKGKLFIAISMRDLVERGASGLHFATGIIELHPHILLQDSLFQDGIALHEYTHFLDLGKVGMKTDRPYQASIKIEKTDPETAKDLGIYRTQFSVDEIRAYRTSLRNNVHRALTAKTREEFSLNYNQIKHDLKTELVFSEITEKVYRKLLLDRDASPNLSPLKRIRERAMGGKVVSLSEVEQYKVIEEYGHDSRSTYEMAKFTSQLFDILNDKLPKNEDVSYEVKYEFVKRMARVLSLPEVRNLKGEYPSMELIEEIFQQ
jgi:hypothetical protein